MSELEKNVSPEMDFSDLDLDAYQESEVKHDAEVAAPPASAQPNMTEEQRKLTLLSRIPVTLTLEVASVEISLAELMNVNNESVIELDKLAGEPLDIKVNGILFGKAEVVVINERYGLRIIEFRNKELDGLQQ